MKLLQERKKKKENHQQAQISITLGVLNIKPKVQKCAKEISDLKKKDIKAAFPYMSIQDREYYSAILHSHWGKFAITSSIDFSYVILNFEWYEGSVYFPSVVS